MNLAARKVAVSACFCVGFILYALPSGLSQKIVCHFNQLTVDDGLTSQEYNHFVFQDRDSYIWINSQSGLNQYDGSKIFQFKSSPNDSIALKNGELNSPFFEDLEGGLWFSSHTHIHRFDASRQQFKNYTLFSDALGKSSSYQLKYIEPTSRKGWARISQTLYAFPLDDPQSSKMVLESDALTYRSTFAFNSDERKVLFFSPTGQGLVFRSFDVSTDEQQDSSIFFTGKKTFSVYYQANNTLWVGLKNKIGRVNLNNQLETIISLPIPKSQSTKVKAITSIDQNLILIATDQNGIFIYDSKREKLLGQMIAQLDDHQEPFMQEVEFFYVAPDQTLWISTYGKGVFFTHLDKIKLQTLFLQDYQEEKQAAGIKAMAEDGQGQIWGITENDIFIWDKKGTPLPALSNKLNQQKEIAPLRFNTIFRDQKNNIWLGTWKGLFVFDSLSSSFKPFLFAAPKKEPTITSIFETQGGELLVSTAENGICKIGWNKELSQWKNTHWIKNKTTYNWIYELKDGSLLVNSFGQNIERFSPKLSPTLKDTIISNVQYTGFIEDPARQKLWLPSYKGLYFINLTEDSLNVQLDSTFGTQAIPSLQLDNDHNIWVSGLGSISKFSPEKPDSIKVYDKPTGLQGTEFIFGSSLKTQDGRLLFGGVNGINIISPDSLEDIATDAKPVVNEIILSGVNKDANKDIFSKTKNPALIKYLELKYSPTDPIEFSFAPREYSDPQTTAFKVLLIRNNSDTLDRSESRSVRYVDLSPGKYLLQVFASNSDGKENKKPHNLEFKILPPWYRTWWFYILVGIAVVGLAISYYNFRIRQIKRKEAARLEKAEMETAILRLQMNPHFLFNSINSIGGLIFDKDPMPAYTALTRFSKLMRSILDLAASPTISLEDEVKLLDQYIKVEQSRFENKLAYSITVDDQLDAETVQIPTMLFQPFIENSIKHGISPKEEGGHIQISFQKIDNEYLKGIIEDNGIGRKKAAEQKKKDHTSKAMEITSHRLKILEEQTGKNTDLQIEDLYDSEEQAIGTRVIVTLPMV